MPFLKRFDSHSLGGRLTLASLLLLPFILGLAALILERSFNESLQASQRAKLELQTYVLMGAAEAGGGELWMPSILQEPRFTQPGSGLFGVISDPKGKVLWQSPSSVGVQMPPPPMLQPEAPVADGQLDNDWFYFSYEVIWQTEDGRETPFIFTTYESPVVYREQLNAFRMHLWFGLAVLGFLLLTAQTTILRWSLSPLRQIAADLAKIEQGKSEKLTGEYPKEIAQVTDNLNLLLENERRQRQRYHDTLSDLAHSLKTPLAVIRNYVDERKDAELSEPVDRMDQIISHQLNRASQQPGHRLLKPVPVQPCLQRIGNALTKVYRDKNARFTLSGATGTFRGDERDLMEVLGNLLDNAFKYGQGKVEVRVDETRGQLIIEIHDDGPGISPHLQETVFNRGIRADSLQPGQGIGLSVVKDILSAYEGELSITDSLLGGACFRVSLPR